MRDAGRWQRVKEVFDEALACDGNERAAVIRDRCFGDHALQADVESLLSADRDRGTVLEQPVPPALGDLAVAALAGGRDALAHILPPGTEVGTYTITGLLGTGGMGQVYRADDGTLGREVAIKVLPRHWRTDSEHCARFEREARLLAALSHPHIATIYGVAEGSGIHGLVLELIDGETLAERIARQPGSGLRVKDALTIAAQIAEALEAAHERGIVHCDLKPSNIKIGSDGRLKVLDFGLARFAAENVASIDAPATDTTTRTSAMFGTAPYMSPEQARGDGLDRRTDVWALGCVLYEMLTGERAFQGGDVNETLSLVAQQDPDFSRVPRETPAAVVRLMVRCMEKDRAKRLPHVAVARFQLTDSIADVTANTGAVLDPARRHQMRYRLMAGIVLGAVAGLSIASLTVRPGRSPTTSVTRLLVDVSPGEHIGGTDGRPTRTAFAISPDGMVLVFSAQRANRRALYVRRFDQTDAALIPGTDGAESPFFSPDGAWVGYWANGRILKARLSGGAPVTVTEAPSLFGGSWDDEDRIVFSTDGGLLEVRASGGPPTPLTVLDNAQAELSHRLPHALPGSDGVLFTITKNRFPRWDETQIAVYSRRTRTYRVLIDGGADARYASSGHLVYIREGVLLAAAFDLGRLQLTGGPVGVVADVMQAAYSQGQRGDTGAGQFAISNTGTLVYVPGGIVPPAERSLVRVDRSGRSQALRLTPRPFATLRLSPNGEEIALSTFGRDRGVWVYAPNRGTFNRLAAPGRNGVPVWSPDGDRIAYAAGTRGPDTLRSMRADGGGTTEPLVAADQDLVPAVWTPDARQLLFYPVPPSAIRVHDVTAHDAPVTIAPAAGNVAVGGADVSPDGRWVAYHSDESGGYQVYVQAYPGGVPRYQISADGGISPIWRRNGRELFYVRQNAPSAGDGAGDISIMTVPVVLAPALISGAPKELFRGPYAVNRPARAYDVSHDGRHFLLLQSRELAPERITRMHVVQNWFEELDGLSRRHRRTPPPTPEGGSISVFALD